MLSILILLLVHATSAVNVLIFLVGTTQFERATLEYLAQQLALRHHNVATVKPILIPEEARLVRPKLHLVRELTLKSLATKTMSDQLIRIGNEIPWRRQYSIDDHLRPYWRAYNHSCALMLNSNLMDKLKVDSFDVAIVYAGNPCQLAIVHALALPFIYLDLDGLSDETAVAAGLHLQSSSSTNCRLDVDPSIFSRMINIGCKLREYAAQSGYYRLASIASDRYRSMDGPISQMFRDDYELKKRFPYFPDVNTIKQSAELYFINSDPMLIDHVALPANVILVGGMHIDAVKPLFSPWNTSMSSASDGVIVCSLGTVANSSAMPVAVARAFVGAFGKLDNNRIYWRIGREMQIAGTDGLLEKLPDHINVTSFIPQNDLLGAKETRLLITNGGMHSIMEAIAHGIPMLGIPLYGTNRHNLQLMQARGLGLIIEKENVTEKNLLKAIRELLDNPKYKTTAKTMSKIYADRPVSAFDTALYWIEYVGRQHGARFVKPERRQSLIRQLHLDVITVTSLMLVGILFVVHRCLFGLVALWWYNRRRPEPSVNNRECTTKQQPIDTSIEQEVVKEKKVTLRKRNNNDTTLKQQK